MALRYNPETGKFENSDEKRSQNVLYGDSVPTADIGNDGDFYINTSNWTISQKAKGVWKEPVSLVGKQGESIKGERGATGRAGKKGEQGPPGERGVGINSVDQVDDKTAIVTLTDGRNFPIFLPRGVNGRDGREVELQASDTHFQWRYVGEESWVDLAPIPQNVFSSGGGRLRLVDLFGMLQAGSNISLTQDKKNKSIIIDLVANPLLAALGITGTDGIDFTPGSDVDVDLITVNVTGTPTFKWNEAGDAFQINGKLVLGSDGNGEVTHTIAGTSVTSGLEVHSNGVSDLGGVTIHRHSNSNDFGGHLIFMRGRGTHETELIVQDNDYLGRLIATGYDGTDEELAGEIRFVVDGTPANNQMPGAIEFYTNAGTQTLVKALTINSSQQVVFPDDKLLIQNPAGTFNYIFSTSAIAADRTVSLPLLTTNDTFAFQGFANNFTGNNVFTGQNTVNESGYFIYADSACIIGNTIGRDVRFAVDAGQGVSTVLSFPAMDTSDTVMTLATNQTVSGNKTYTGKTTHNGGITAGNIDIDVTTNEITMTAASTDLRIITTTSTNKVHLEDTNLTVENSTFAALGYSTLVSDNANGRVGIGAQTPTQLCHLFVPNLGSAIASTMLVQAGNGNAGLLINSAAAAASFQTASLDFTAGTAGNQARYFFGCTNKSDFIGGAFIIADNVSGLAPLATIDSSARLAVDRGFTQELTYTIHAGAGGTSGNIGAQGGAEFNLAQGNTATDDFRVSSSTTVNAFDITMATNLFETNGLEHIFNNGGGNFDFTVESVNNANCLQVDASADAVGVNVAAPNATFHVYEATADAMVRKIEGLASSATDNSIMEEYIVDATTNAGVAVVAFSYTHAANTTVRVMVDAVARRTGGSAGTAEDGAGYSKYATFKNVAGTTTQIGTTGSPGADDEDQAGWGVSIAPPLLGGAGIEVSVTGAANNNVSWHLYIRIMKISS